MIVFYLLVMMVSVSYLVHKALAALDARNSAPAQQAPDMPWRQINLACGDGYDHPEADPALAELRRRGWHIEKSGNERGAFVYLKLVRTGPGEGGQ